MAASGALTSDKGEAKGAGMMPTIVAVAILTLLAGAGGGGLGFLLAHPPVEPVKAPGEGQTSGEPEAQAESAGHDSGTDTASAAAKPLEIIPLAPIVTNVSSPPNTWLRIEASLVVEKGAAENDALLAEQVKADTLAYLRSVQLAELDGTRGLLHLRDDLRERAMMRSPAVVDYLIGSLVAE